MLGADIIKLMGSLVSAPGGGSIVLHDDFFEDEEWNGGGSSARWVLLGDNISGLPNGEFPNYTWLLSGDPADYEVVIVGSGFTTGAAGTYSCDTGVTLTVSRATQGTTGAHFTASIQLASNPGVYLASCSVTIRAITHNFAEP